MRPLALYRRLFTQIYPARTLRKRVFPNLRPMSTSIPQTRSLADSEVEGPVLKKQRIEVEKAEVSMEEVVDEPAHSEQPEIKETTSVALADVESGTGQIPSALKPKKRKKRKDPPLPEPCSAADVLYQEIRELLGGDVVDSVAEAGGAFQSPFSYQEEVTVKIESLGSGGALFFCIY